MNTGFNIVIDSRGRGFHIDNDDSDAKSSNKGAYIEKNLNIIVKILKDNIPGDPRYYEKAEHLHRLKETIMGLNDLHASNIGKISKKRSSQISKLLAEAHNLVSHKINKVGTNILIPKAEAEWVNKLSRDPTSRFANVPRDILSHVLNPMLNDSTKLEDTVPFEIQDAGKVIDSCGNKDILDAAKNLDFKGSPEEAKSFLKGLVRGFMLLKESPKTEDNKFYKAILENVFPEGDRPIEDRPISLSDLTKIKLYFQEHPYLYSHTYTTEVNNKSPIDELQFIITMQGLFPKYESYFGGSILKETIQANDWDKLDRLLQMGFKSGINNSFNTLINDKTIDRTKFLDLCKKMIISGVNINAWNFFAPLPLERAIQAQDKALANLYLDFDANVAILAKEYRNSTWFKDLLKERNAA